MPRTMPVHAGYHIINGAGAGPQGGRLQVWIEYSPIKTDVAGNRTWLAAYFYAALDPNYTANVGDSAGLNVTFTVDGISAPAAVNNAYDFTDANVNNLLGSFEGWVSHDDTGEKTVTLAGSFTTSSSAITGGSVSGEGELPRLFPAAKPNCQDCILGEPCRVSWTPISPNHTFRLLFHLGDWSYDTGTIAPNTTNTVTYTDFVLPLELAKQFPGVSDRMDVILVTYDKGAVVDSFMKTVTVTVPDNENTRPKVQATISPVGDAFPGQYVQLLSKVSAAVTAQDPLDADIVRYTIAVGNTRVEGLETGLLDISGQTEVTVTAENTRGFVGVWQDRIQVFPYTPPRLLSAAAYRCLADGQADAGGTHLGLTASWSHSPVEGQNQCSLRWRYQQEGGEWSSWQTLDAADAVELRPVSGVVLERDTAYSVELEILDLAGGSAQSRFFIPVEQVYMHRTKNAMGLGGFAETPDTLDVHWDLQARKSINGVYIRTKRLFLTKQMAIQTMFSAFDGQGDVRQSIWLFGNDNGLLIRGVMGVSNSGQVYWDGTEGVTLSADPATGVVTVTFPYAGYDRFVFVSPDPFA